MKKKILSYVRILDCFKWYRKAIGGRWEYWIMDFPMNSSWWFSDEFKELKKEGRPHQLCRGTPRVENY